MKKNKKDKTVFVGFYSNKGGVGKTTGLFSLTCLITGNGTKKINNLCIINCDHSSLSIKNLLKQHKFSIFNEKGDCVDGVSVENNSIYGLRAFAKDALYSPDKKNTKYVLIDFAGFMMSKSELSEIVDIIDIWVVPVYPSKVCEYSIASVYQDLLEVGVSKEQIITYINKLKPEKHMSTSMLENTAKYFKQSGLMYPKDNHGYRIDAEYFAPLEKEDSKAISLISNTYCRKVFRFIYAQIDSLWKIKNNK